MNHNHFKKNINLRSTGVSPEFRSQKHGISCLTCFFLFLLFVGCEVKNVGSETKNEALLSGKTMGTTYHIKVVTGPTTDVDKLKAQIDKRLQQISHSMSTYLPDSEISQFNNLDDINKLFTVSKDFYDVLTIAKRIYHITDGAWDGTVSPLINIWGFGAKSRGKKIPTQDEIDRLKQKIGFHQIELIKPFVIRKKKPYVTLDLASIAKGYGVDQIAKVIETNGINDFLVEVGGEIYASGCRKDKNRWRVGVNVPQPDAPRDAVFKAVGLKDKAMATSGDYRNFFTDHGKRYAHILDPRTGYPPQNRVASVSVIADKCAFADGLATAIMVMGTEAGMKLINQLDRVEGLFIVRQEDGRFKTYISEGFESKASSNNN